MIEDNYCCDKMKKYYDIDYTDLKKDIWFLHLQIPDGSGEISHEYINIEYCPWCGKKLEAEPQLPKSQLQILQEKKDGMVDTKRLVDGLNKLLDDWYRDKENGHT